MTTTRLRWERIVRENRDRFAAIPGALLSAANGKTLKSVLVTSARREEGKSTVAAYLAYGLATQLRSRVLLVDAHLRSPRVHELFEMRLTRGLSDLLAGNDGLEGALRPTHIPGLRILSCGSRLEGYDAALDPVAFEALLRDLEMRADTVIFDGDSVLTSSQTWVHARLFDATILVVECERTKWEVVDQCHEQIAKAGGRVLGIILNKRKYYVPNIVYSRL